MNKALNFDYSSFFPFFLFKRLWIRAEQVMTKIKDTTSYFGAFLSFTLYSLALTLVLSR